MSGIWVNTTAMENQRLTLEALIDAKQDLPEPAVRRALRLGVGLSLAEVSDEVGVSKQAIANYEHGTRTPRGSTLIAYVRALQAMETRGSRDSR